MLVVRIINCERDCGDKPNVGDSSLSRLGYASLLSNIHRAVTPKKPLGMKNNKYMYIHVLMTYRSLYCL